MTSRHNTILEIITEHERVEVSKLADMVGVSRVTVRKDLDQLEAQGLILREHGYALISSQDDIANRLAFHYDVKRKIAQSAAEQVKNGETVMIESGSCCTLLADELVHSKRDVTIITNSAFIANYVRKVPGAKIVLLGGDYQNDSQVMVGPITQKCVEEYFVDKIYVGTDGFNMRYGFTGNDRMRAETARDMTKQAANIIILTQSEKFSRQGVVGLFRTEEAGVVYTDEDIPADVEELLKRKGVTLHKV